MSNFRADPKQQPEDSGETPRARALKLTEAEIRERRGMAHTLHDDLQQRLAAAKMLVDILRSQRSKDPQKALEEIAQILGGSVIAMRWLSFELHPRMLEQQGLAAALREVARWARETRRLSVEVEADPRAEPRESVLRDLFFRVAVERLGLVAAHAPEQPVRVSLTLGEDHYCRLVVEDSGGGVRKEASSNKASRADRLDLADLRWRIEALGGGMAIDTTPERGTRVALWAPNSR